MYCIAVLHHFYQEVRTPKFVEEDGRGGSILYFETIEEAREWIKEAESEVYVLEHNEYMSPEYIIVEDIVAEFIRSGRNQDLSNYDWSGCVCTKGPDGEPCGECNECFSHMAALDRDYIWENAIK